MIIRNMSAKDKDNFLSMSDIFYSSEAALHGFDRSIQERNFTASLNNSPSIRCLMFEDECGTILGYAIICHSWSTELGGPILLVEELYLKPQYRGHGHAREFFQWLFNEYEEKAVGFRLEVAPANAQVMEVYSKYGFKPLEYLQMIRSLPSDTP